MATFLVLTEIRLLGKMSPETTQENDERYLVLVEFVYKHMNFQLPELQSILEMHDIQLGGPDCRIVSLPNAQGETSSSSLEDYEHRRPFVILSFPSNFADRISTNVAKWDCSSRIKASSGIGEILNRCALVRSVVELWGYSTSIEECAKVTHEWGNESRLGKTIYDRVGRGPSKSWKLTVHTFGTKYNREEQDSMRRHYTDLFTGPVKMEDFDNEFILIREVELNAKGNPVYPRHVKKELIPENDARPPLGVYFGRVIGALRKGRGGLIHYDLKNRAYLGPTSMDAELSFVMTSLGHVQKGSIVYDPFVGTGSILLSCALRGAYCIGSDIDIRVLNGRGEKENIWKNFEQYKLQRPEILRTDNAIYHRHYRQHQPLYDAIVCDPPYGIRAGARKTGSRRDIARHIPDERRHDHIPQTKPYPVSDVMSDLLNVAASSLAIGGRLVYVIPSFEHFNPDTDLPRHDCLELVHSCYQPLSLELGRRIVAMKKICDYDPSKREEYQKSIWVNGTESAEKCANLREKILENAKKKPGYEEKLAVRKQKRKEHKQLKKAAKRLRAQEDATTTG